MLTDPTTGGVTASFAMLGDLNIAEPKALIGFAGPRVIEQTIRQKLPEGFQRSEFLLEKGMLDLVVDRREMKAVIANALRFMGAGAARTRVEPPPRTPPSRRRARHRTLVTATTLAYLFGLEQFGIKFGLENIRDARSRALGHPERAFRSIHVAGTNGKGSVTAMVDAALRAAGHRIGALHVAAPRRPRPSASSSTAARSTAATLAARRRATCATRRGAPRGGRAATCSRRSSR